MNSNPSPRACLETAFLVAGVTAALAAAAAFLVALLYVVAHGIGAG